ncbi:MAG: hypothetical protein E5X35_28735 [Mesorhizobium sp.]|uniref:hypothetical protein n=1 Tax=Mesorhizobium sp. TaxID=1871066 RepID=UPI001214B2DC|nr:hypothetical protein [Mesorhizobium sp.]TIR28929.1 MAG: hypothetical protein E5X35_28735 [Mesorhizobium sp.]
MNQNILLALAGTAGLVAGAGGTWFAVSSSSNETRAISKAEITAAIEADPSLCPAPLTPPPAPAPKTSELAIPTEAEALAAFRKAQESSPLVWDRDQLPEVSLTLGQCDTNNSGPGVACMTTIKLSPQAEPVDRLIGFAQSASGEWVATPY